MGKNNKTIHEKAEWFDALCQLLDMGFDIERNSARDLMASTNELLAIKSAEQKKVAETFYTGGGIWLSAKYIDEHIYAVIDNDYEGVISYYDDRADEDDEVYGCFDCIRSVDVDLDDDATEEDKMLYEELHNELAKFCEV